MKPIAATSLANPTGPATPTMVNCAAYSSAGIRLPSLSVEAISDHIDAADGFVWIGLHEPDAAMLAVMQSEFSLHDLAIEDAANAHQRPKIEVYGDGLFIALHTAQLINGHIEFGETHIFLNQRSLLTIRHGASLSYAPARMRCEREPHLLKLGPSYALYAVLDFIVDNFMPIVSEFEDELEALEKDIFGAAYKDGRIIQRLYELKRELVTLRLAVSPMQDILNQLVRFHAGLIHDDVRLYYRDVFDHAVRVNEATDTVREMLTAAMGVHLSLVTVAQGEVVKRLAGWAGLIAAPTLVTSWYGMNFVHMPELANPASYWIVMGVTASVCIALFIALKRAKWL
ncbi:MAG: magnesium and cobalt transport protein CorA [Pseudomarimonas sp.]